MKRLQPGVRVRFIGQPKPFNDVMCLLLVGRTGVIRGESATKGMGWWDVEMDIGCYDMDAHESTLLPIDDCDADERVNDVLLDLKEESH